MYIKKYLKESINTYDTLIDNLNAELSAKMEDVLERIKNGNIIYLYPYEIDGIDFSYDSKNHRIHFEFVDIVYNNLSNLSWIKGLYFSESKKFHFEFTKGIAKCQPPADIDQRKKIYLKLLTDYDISSIIKKWLIENDNFNKQNTIKAKNELLNFLVDNPSRIQCAYNDIGSCIFTIDNRVFAYKENFYASSNKNVNTIEYFCEITDGTIENGPLIWDYRHFFRDEYYEIDLFDVGLDVSYNLLSKRYFISNDLTNRDRLDIDKLLNR